MTGSARTCAVCERPLAWRTPLTPHRAATGGASEFYALCDDFECRTLFRQAEEAPGVNFQQTLAWRAKARRDHAARVARLEARHEAEALEEDAAFRVLARRAAIAPDLQLSLPSGPRRQRRVSQARRRAYAAHLDTAIAAALDPSTPPSEPSPDPEGGAGGSSLPGRVCGACGGGCCAVGHDHAFLSAKTIRRVLAAAPGLEPARLRQTYLDHLPERAMQHSCINHAVDGCSLPRSLRSDVCNVYVCTAIRDVEAGLKADPPVRTVLALRRRQSLWRQAEPGLMLSNDILDGAVVTETGIRRLRAPRTPELQGAEDDAS